MRITHAWVAVALVLLTSSAATSQTLRIGIIDFYGLLHVSEAQARIALTVKEGDAVVVGVDAPPPGFLRESERRLSLLPGVQSAHVTLICCDEAGAIVYVGIQKLAQLRQHFGMRRAEALDFPVTLFKLGAIFLTAVNEAVQRGDATEDTSHGYSLIHDPAGRAIQQRFIEYAKDPAYLGDVLRNSSDEDQRALAAQILPYASNQAAVIDDLVYAMNDASGEVRNNATRALYVIAGASSQLARRIPIAPFIDLLHSFEWSDRNKASLALVSLTKPRDPALLTTLRSQAITQLVDMARWKSRGHSTPALLILGRIADQSDEATQAALERGDRESIIEAAQQ